MTKSRKPQTEQQILARNEGRALGQVGMMESNLDQLYKLGFISVFQYNCMEAMINTVKEEVKFKQRNRMIKAGTYKGMHNG